jgi:hypothetical protein
MGRLCKLIILCLFFDVSAYAANSSFGNALVDAVEYEDVKLIKQLIANKYNVNAPGRFGSTALMRAVYHQHNDITELLLKAGANANIQDIAGTTALHVASRQGYTHLVKLLIDKGAIIDVIDHEGFTPLMRAVSAGRSEVVKLLLAHNADARMLNNFGQSAQSLAQRGRYKKIKGLFSLNHESSNNITVKAANINLNNLPNAAEEKASANKIKVGAAIKVEGDMPKLLVIKAEPLPQPVEIKPAKIGKIIEDTSPKPVANPIDKSEIQARTQGFYMYVKGFKGEKDAVAFWNWVLTGKNFTKKTTGMLVDKQKEPALRIGYYLRIKEVFHACKDIRNQDKTLYCYAMPVGLVTGK